ncbi:hypothetical protein WMY93_031363 [Mugilogobius chulae]|uniref:L1 transposable element RRM domain-containing protein n=1 Tax=Mugilogobius chulae TaxID=88201 RepID=A0AAW0MNA4_9GOBI
MADHLDIADALRQLQVDLTSHFDSKIGELQSTLITMNGSITTLSEQVSLIEHRISTNEDNITNLDSRVKFLEKENSFLRDKVDDLENRSRSSNLRFLRIPERAEGRDTVDFIQRLILLLLAQLFWRDVACLILSSVNSREKNLQYSLRYPAVLRVNIDGKFTAFRCPKTLKCFFKASPCELRIRSTLITMNGSITTLSEQVSLIEHRISTNEDNLTNLDSRVKFLEKENSFLRDKVDDLENRSRSSNLRFLRIPERAEGRDTVDFIQRLILLLLGADKFPVPPVIERAHRSPTTMSPKSKNGPRPILVKFLNAQDKVKILRLARERGELLFEGTKVFNLPRTTAQLFWRDVACLILSSVNSARKNLQYSLRYPAVLRVNIDGKFTRISLPPKAR